MTPMAAPNDPFAQFSISGARRSASGEASRREEIERVKKMSPVERMGLALRLGRRRVELLELFQKTRQK